MAVALFCHKPYCFSYVNDHVHWLVSMRIPQFGHEKKVKQGYCQPRFYSKARALSTQLFSRRKHASNCVFHMDTENEIVRAVPNHHLQRCIKNKLKCLWRHMQPLQSYKLKLCRCMIRLFYVSFMQSLYATVWVLHVSLGSSVWTPFSTTLGLLEEVLSYL